MQEAADALRCPSCGVPLLAYHRVLSLPRRALARGVRLTQRQRSAAALAHLGVARVLAPESDAALRRYALCLVELKRYQRALDALAEAPCKPPWAGPLAALCRDALQHRTPPAKPQLDQTYRLRAAELADSAQRRLDALPPEARAEFNQAYPQLVRQLLEEQCRMGDADKYELMYNHVANNLRGITRWRTIAPLADSFFQSFSCAWMRFFASAPASHLLYLSLIMNEAMDAIDDNDPYLLETAHDHLNRLLHDSVHSGRTTT